MALIESLGLRPTAQMQQARSGGVVAPPPPPRPGPGMPRRAAEPAESSGAAVKGGLDVEVISREFPAVAFKYGELKLAGTLKFLSMAAAGNGNSGLTGAATSKDKPTGRVHGTKKTIAYGDIADRELFAGFSLADISVGFEPQISGLDISVAGLVKFTVVTKAFRAAAQAKLIVLNIKGGKEIAGPALEIKLAPVTFPYRSGAADLKVFAEYQATFTVNAKQVGAEVGKKAVEMVAKDLLEREAKRRGVKVLARGAAETVLKRLGPVAAAFGVGLDIGALLNQYTIAPKAAKFVIDEILGDLFQRYHATDTLGKMWLLTKNSPRILAALVAGGVIGTAAGVADVVLFKLFGLDKLPDYADALRAFGQGLTELAAVARVPLQVVGGAIVHRALEIGLKFDPKRTRAHHATLEPVIAAIHAHIRPIYRTSGGLNKLLAVRVKDASGDEAGFLKFAAYAHRNGLLQGGVALDMASPATLADSLRRLSLSDFLRWLEANNLIASDVKLDGNLDPDAIDPKLLEELLG